MERRELTKLFLKVAWKEETLRLLNAPKLVLEMCSEDGSIGGKGLGEGWIKGINNKVDRMIKEGKGIEEEIAMVIDV